MNGDRKGSVRSRAGAGLLALALTLVAALSIAACGSDDDSGSGGSGGSGGRPSDFTMGISMPFLTADFEVVMQKQFLEQAKAAGIKTLQPTNADSDAGKQIADVRNLISQGAEGMLVVANDSKAIIPALDYADSQDVKVVSADIGPDGGKVAMIVRADNLLMGEQACDEIARRIGDKGKVLSLQGALTSINGRERTEGFRKCVQEKHPEMELIERPTDWDPAKQVAAIQTVLTANPDLKGIFMQSDYALAASLNAMKKAGKGAKVGEPGHVVTVSVDATPQGLDLIRRKQIDAEISQPLDLYAKYGVQYLQEAMGGKTFKPGRTDHGTRIVMFNGNPMDLLPSTLVTEKNVDDPQLWGNQK